MWQTLGCPLDGGREGEREKKREKTAVCGSVSQLASPLAGYPIQIGLFSMSFSMFEAVMWVCLQYSTGLCQDITKAHLRASNYMTALRDSIQGVPKFYNILVILFEVLYY